MSQVPRQRPGPRRAGRALRRRHRPPVPDVHGPVGPGRAVEPDRDRRRAPVPEPRLDDRARPARPRAGRPDAGRAAGGRGPTPRARAAMRHGRPPDAARRHRGLRGFRWNTMVAKLMELANVLMRYRGTTRRRRARVGRGGPAAAADARAGGAAHHRGAVVAPRWTRAARPWSSIHLQRWPRSTSRSSSRRRARSRSRSTASSATGSRCRPASPRSSWSRSCSRATRSWRSSRGREPHRVIHAGGGRLVNIVVR